MPYIPSSEGRGFTTHYDKLFPLTITMLKATVSTRIPAYKAGKKEKVITQNELNIVESEIKISSSDEELFIEITVVPNTPIHQTTIPSSFIDMVAPKTIHAKNIRIDIPARNKATSLEHFLFFFLFPT